VAAPDPTGQLLALIPAEVRDCAPAEQPHDDLALASVDCGQSELSPAVTGFAFDLYGSTSDLQSEMDAIIARHPDGVRAIQDCLTSEGNTRWVQGSHGGVMVCGPGTSGLWRIWWTDEAVDVLGEAEVSTNSGADYQALYQWWLDNAALGV
jgi:hypothetical protein